MEPIETLNLWTSPKTLWIEAPGPNRNLPVVAIHRTADCIKVQLTEPSSISTVAVRKTIHGVLGIAELPLGAYLIVIAHRKKVGDVDGQPVHRLETAECIPIWGKAATSSQEAEAHRYCLNLLHETLGTPYFYFSYTGDLTNNAGNVAKTFKNKLTLHRFLSASSSSSRFHIFENLVLVQHFSPICVILRFL